MKRNVVPLDCGVARLGSVRRGRLADVIGVKGRAVVFGGPEPSSELVGDGAGGLVVAGAVAESDGPGGQSVEFQPFLASRSYALLQRSGAVDAQFTQVAVAAAGERVEVAGVSAGELPRR